ncbi:hypothetical protein BAE44_0013062 [Dichanthelium oligosanthes]|uniref:RNase H type-1 domain-containing protein n=1 Tax=Dichanthelium oligosanthes TaxID=888268 RepID=A0A1E5VLA4_9POAL|nr:hypothetical protein BAE44_0013062 [Dichanthelium oligosanthes]
MLLFWRVWHPRNDSVFSKGDCPISASVNFLENFLASLIPGMATVPLLSEKGKSIRPCDLHSPHWIKLNVDAGYDPNTNHAGLGFIARDHLGDVVFSGWSNDRLCKSAEEAECLAALTGVRQIFVVSQGPI